MSDLCPATCPEHPRRIDITDAGHVLLNGVRVGSVHPGSRINGRLTWRAWDVEGNAVPPFGNRVRSSEQAAAEMLVEMVRDA